ncbi:MAG: SAM-dependent methyltransferase [Gammaproteobacteria bacterium]
MPTPQHNQALVKQLRQAIEQHGPLNFAEFMHQALYAPGLGYYSSSLPKLGKEGDFVTAPEISPLFSYCIANACQPVLQAIGSQANILEFGAGSGSMAAAILQRLAILDSLPAHYYILETSGDLQQRQRQYLQQHCPEYYSRVSWLSQLPAPGFQGVILANEVLDAMPVHRFKCASEQLLEYYVDYQDHQFTWCTHPATEAIKQAVATLKLPNTHHVAYTSEINLNAAPWVNSIAHCLERGLVLIIDYGFLAHEYYHPDRHMGTLMCHYQHRAHTDPLKYIGLQDITAHVNFSALITAAHQQQLEIAGFTTQAEFLMQCGLLDLLAQHQPEDLAHYADYYPLAQQVKKLLLPSEMGELFKVLGLTRNINNALTGFNR